MYTFYRAFQEVEQVHLHNLIVLVLAIWLLIGGILEAIIFAVVPDLFTVYRIAAWGLAGVLLIVASGLLFLIEAL